MRAGVTRNVPLAGPRKSFTKTFKTNCRRTKKPKVYYFSLGPAEVPLPLGWMLSNQAAHAMHQELTDEGKSKKTPVETWNKAVRQMIIDSLPQPNTAAVPQKVGKRTRNEQLIAGDARTL